MAEYVCHDRERRTYVAIVRHAGQTKMQTTRLLIKNHMGKIMAKVGGLLALVGGARFLNIIWNTRPQVAFFSAYK